MIVLIRKSVLLSLILYILSSPVWGQNDPYRAEIGFQTGLNLYSGDVNSISDLGLYGKNFNNQNADFGLMLRYRFNKRLAVRLGYDYTKVKGNYLYRDAAETFTATLNNPLHLVDFWGEFNFFDLENNPYKRFSKRFSPFIFAGVGMVFTPEYKSEEPKSSPLTIPFGAGFKWKMADKLNFNIQYTSRWVIGDFLEGKPEFDNPIPKTTSNPMNNDRLSGISIGFSYDFWTRDCDCPGGTLDKGRKASPQKIVKQIEPKKKKRNQRFQ